MNGAVGIDVQFELRRRWMLGGGALLVLAVSLVLLPLLASQGRHAAWIGPACAALGGLLVLALLALRHDRLATWGFIAAMGLSVALLGLWVDLPQAATPRSVQLYLLPLLLMAYLLLSREPAWARALCCALLLGLLLLLCLWPNPLGLPSPLDEALRRPLAWLAPAVSALLLALIAQLRLADLRGRAGMELDLARAIVEDRLELQYQPQCDAQGLPHGVEALVRWRHPRLGPISPASFVPLAESNGLILPLGELVLRKACEFAQAQAGGAPGLSVAVNVSALQLADAAAFERLLQIVRRQQLPPRTLKFELTESVLAGQIAPMRALLERCRAAGVATALDDFGTGYASLAYLSALPFDQLKIDQGFVRGLEGKERSRQIARTVVQLGRQLDMEVIAEGVETRAQLELLRDMGCERFQGYLFARPLDAADCAAWLRARSAGPL